MMNTMGSGMSAFEWHGPQVPNQQEIIKDLHQQLMVKELRIKEAEQQLSAAQAEIERLKIESRDACMGLSEYYQLKEASQAAEIERLKGDFELLKPNKLCDMGCMLSCSQEAQHLLATQALQIKELRDALCELADAGEDAWDVNRPCQIQAREALSKPYSPEALRKYVADEIDRMGKGLFGVSGWAESYRKGEV